MLSMNGYLLITSRLVPFALRLSKGEHGAITLCTTTALLVCTVIAVLFLSAFLRFDASIPVALLFIAAMLCFFLGLLWLLREIYLATMSLRIEPR